MQLEPGLQKIVGIDQSIESDVAVAEEVEVEAERMCRARGPVLDALVKRVLEAERRRRAAATLRIKDLELEVDVSKKAADRVLVGDRTDDVVEQIRIGEYLLDRSLVA